MNSGFDPMVVAPSLFKVQTKSQQVPFRFGGSQVPIHLGMRGSGDMRINRPKIPEALMRERMSGRGDFFHPFEDTTPVSRSSAQIDEDTRIAKQRGWKRLGPDRKVIGKGFSVGLLGSDTFGEPARSVSTSYTPAEVEAIKRSGAKLMGGKRR